MRLQEFLFMEGGYDAPTDCFDSNKELDALVKLAQCEMRDPREQMRSSASRVTRTPAAR
jgi:hypothetical protein